MAANPQSFGQSKQISSALLPEFEHEMKTTHFGKSAGRQADLEAAR